MTQRISEVEIPDTLFKYRDWSNAYHKRLITNQEIYFARASEFNDPFDSNIPVRWDLMTYEDCLQKNLDMLNIIHKNVDQQLVYQLAKKVTDEKTLWHPDALARERPEQLKKWNSIMGLFSLSSVPDNILMWSHYSSNHQGFVVGFDSKALLSDYEFDFMEPINYQRSYPIISGLEDQSSQFYKKFFFKSELWSYEQEWRITKNHIEKRTVNLKPETITQIIFGCYATRETIEEGIKLIHKHLKNDIRILKAEKTMDTFGLIMKGIE